MSSGDKNAIEVEKSIPCQTSSTSSFGLLSTGLVSLRLRSAMVITTKLLSYKYRIFPFE